MALRVKAVGQTFLHALRQSIPRGPDRLAPSLGSLRHSSEIGSGEGKGGGSGGPIRSSGGSLGKRSQVLEEEYFREKQSKELKQLQETLKRMRLGKVEYHEKQLKRHLDKIKKHEELMAKDKDPNHKIYIESHKESAEAHTQYIEKLKKEWK